MGGGVLCFGVTLGLFGAGDEDGVGCAAPMHPPGFGGTNTAPPPVHHHGCGVSVGLSGGPQWGQCPPPPHSATTEGHLLFFLPPPLLFLWPFSFFLWQTLLYVSDI